MDLCFCLIRPFLVGVHIRVVGDGDGLLPPVGDHQKEDVSLVGQLIHGGGRHVAAVMNEIQDVLKMAVTAVVHKLLSLFRHLVGYDGECPLFDPCHTHAVVNYPDEGDWEEQHRERINGVYPTVKANQINCADNKRSGKGE